MEATFVRLNRHWNGIEYPATLHNREILDVLLKKKRLPHVQVLTGIRRSGKSTLFQLLINDLLNDGINPKEILLLNMDESAFISTWENASELYKLIESAEKLTSCKVRYLFLDEIQQIKDWELFAKSAYDTNRFEKIYVTGSNSNLLQNQFSTLLSGRYFSNRIYPFSLNELLQINHFSYHLSIVERKPELLILVDNYLAWGGFPEIVLGGMDNDTKTELLNSYYESIVLKDCIVYNKVRETTLFHKLLYSVLSNIASPLYYNGIGKAVKANEHTTRNYLLYAVQAHILSDISNFSFSLKEDSRPQHKFYCADNGLINTIGFRFSQNLGALLENVVHNELVYAGYDLISFVKLNKECDFIARKNNEYHAFQVCYELNAQNETRELSGFNVLGKDIKIASKHIITYNQKKTIGDVTVSPIWEFFGIA